jgi:hypothetical protein
LRENPEVDSMREEAKTMRSIRLSRLLLVGMVVLLTLMPAGAAWAKQPERETVEVAEHWFFEDCGDFEVWEHFSATVEITRYLDGHGDIIWISEHWTGTGVVYNASYDYIQLEEKIVHNVGFYDENHEPTGAAGRMVHIVLPGKGLIFIAAGRFYECEDASCTGVAGHNDWVEGDKDALCEALRGP